MEIAKKVVLVVVLVVLLMALYYFYLSLIELSSEPVEFVEKPVEIEKPDESQQGFSELQFYPYMRFAKKSLIYNIDEKCSEDKETRVRQAFTRLEQETNLLKFYQNLNKEMADILVSCTKETESVKGEYFIAGEGGPTEIINTSRFYVIEKGKVLLFYKESQCENYNVELHELLHVFGFEHSNNEKSIMYNTTSCQQILTEDIIEKLKKLYSIEELPDLYFSNISALKHGSYLDFNVEVRNQGLDKAENIKLELYAENILTDDFDLGRINYGEGKFLEVKNIKISRDIENIKFVLVSDNELEKENNMAGLFLIS